MKPTAAQLRAQLEPLVQDFARRTPAKFASIESGLSERQIREYRNENAPVMGCWDFLAFCASRPELHAALAKAMGFHPLDMQLRKAVEAIAELAAQLPEEGDQQS